MQIDRVATEIVIRRVNRSVWKSPQQRDGAVQKRGAPAVSFAQVERRLIVVAVQTGSDGRKFPSPVRKCSQIFKKSIGLQEPNSVKNARRRKKHSAIEQQFRCFWLGDGFDSGQPRLVDQSPE